MTGVLVRKESRHTKTDIRRHRDYRGRIRMMQPRNAEDCWLPPEASKRKGLYSGFRGNMALLTT